MHDVNAFQYSCSVLQWVSLLGLGRGAWWRQHGDVLQHAVLQTAELPLSSMVLRLHLSFTVD